MDNKGNWSDLHLDLLILVVRKIDSVEDYFAFRGVCTGWRLAASYEHDFNKAQRQLPFLLQTRNERLEFSTPLATQQPISTIDPVAALIMSQEMNKIRSCLGCRGWLLVVHNNGDMDLLHVMTRARIKLPRHQRNYECQFGIRNFILSASPLTNPSNCTLLISYELGKLAHWRPGDKTFTEVPGFLAHWSRLGVKTFTEILFSVLDVIYSSSRGVFYGLSDHHYLLVIEENNHEYPTTLAECRNKRRSIPRYCEPVSPFRFSLATFLVESDGDLLLVVQHPGKTEDLVIHDECEFHFRIYKIEEFGKAGYDCEMTEVKNLGNRTVFVGGYGASISVNASDIPGCKANHIYFT